MKFQISYAMGVPIPTSNALSEAALMLPMTGNPVSQCRLPQKVIQLDFLA
jgi:hypothetical protein